MRHIGYSISRRHLRRSGAGTENNPLTRLMHMTGVSLWQTVGQILYPSVHSLDRMVNIDETFMSDSTDRDHFADLVEF